MVSVDSHSQEHTEYEVGVKESLGWCPERTVHAATVCALFHFLVYIESAVVEMESHRWCLERNEFEVDR